MPSSAERWALIDAVFADALERPDEERRGWLVERCGDDEALRSEVERLLALDDRVPSGWLSSTQGASVAGIRRPVTERIGPYRLIRPLGRGGMGTVYLARREDTYRQDVALKIIRGGFVGDALRQRFELERQVLARLEHPNIARLYDGGTTDDGHPYLVLERVDGVPIDRFADARRLTIVQRIELLRDVCAAVSHAHRNLIVHRDLKPSNILVTEDGSVKLLDFGIAKLLAPEVHDAPQALTRTSARPMSPRYASPEQIRGELITVGTDVYALGVLGYELLSGVSPLQPEDPSPFALERATLEQTPRPLSAATTADPGEIAAQRGSTPKEVRNALRGDLDAIFAKALRKRPAARYASVDALAADLDRHLHRRPVRARRGTVRYRTFTFLRRHQVGVAVAGAIFLVASLAVAAIAREGRRAALERDRAREVSDLLVEMFEVSRPDGGFGEGLTARQALAMSAERIRRDDTKTATSQAILLDTLGQIHGDLGLTDEAAVLFQEASSLLDAVGGGDPADRASILNGLARLDGERGLYDQAETAYREALELVPGDSRDMREQRAEALSGLAKIRWHHGDLSDAEALLHQALALRRETFGARHRFALTNLSDLAHLVILDGRLDDGEALAREALELRRQSLGEGHPDLAFSFDDLGALAYRRGRFADAAEHHRASLSIRRKLLPTDSPDLANGCYALARSLQAGGHLAEAEALLVEALDILGRAHPDGHPLTANTLNELAILLGKQRRFEESTSRFEASLAMRQRVLGDDHPDVAQSHYSLANVLHDAGLLEKAEHHYREAETRISARYPADHPAVAFPRVALARLALDRGQLDDAIPALETAIAHLETTLPEGHWRTADARCVLGAALARSGRLEDGLSLLRANAPVVEAQRGPEDPASVRTREWIDDLAPPPATAATDDA